MMGIRKITPGGHEYLVGNVACGDRDLDAGETLADYYFRHGYPPGQWFGAAAAELGMTGEVTAAQMQALFGEGRHPDADGIEARAIAAGMSPNKALEATKLGNRFPRFGNIDDLRTKIREAYTAYNTERGRKANAPINEIDRARIRRDVQTRTFTEVHGAAPSSHEELDAWLSEQRRMLKTATAGYELVFAPPKSVSTAWALGDSATRERIADVHRQAVRNTLTHLEQHAAFTRKGAGGLAQLNTGGIAATLFEHWDSRSGDPHLHTHVPVSTKVQSPDGKWTSLDGRTLLAASVTLSEFYNSRVRDLMREQGANFSQRPQHGIDLKRPVWELDGVPPELLDGFSQRSAAVERERARGIVAHRREHGREPTSKELLEIGRRAQYATRHAKQPAQSLSQHLARWREQAVEIIGTGSVTRLGQRVFGASPDTRMDIDLPSLATATLSEVSEHYAHFNQWNLLAEAHRQSAHVLVPASEREQLVDRIVQTVLDGSETVALQAPALVEEPNSLRRTDGESVFIEHRSQRWTTHQTLREEAALAAWGQRRDGQRITPDTVEAAMRKARLNPGQRAAVTGFATSGRRAQLLLAPAGSGKTTTMRVFADAWRSAGGRVFAFGPSARAAQELGNAIDARPHTLHQVTTAQQLGTAERSFDFARGDVLIIDEAAMAGTHTLHSVARYALERGADVRLVGDDRQLSAVEAGGAVRWFSLQNPDSVLRLREIVRFHDRGQAQASLLLHSADPAGLDYYFDREWVQGGSRETMRAAAHRAWRADLDQGRQSLLIVPSNEDVVDLNLQARELRLARGDVDSQQPVRLHDGTAASGGDWVVTRHNDRLKTLFRGTDFVKNGDTWTVQRVHRDGALKLRHQTSGGTLVLPAEYVRSHVELAYAATVNRVQGMTSEHTAHGVVTRGLSREQLYTLVTRARGENRLFVETHEHTLDSHRETPLESTPRGVLETALTRSSAETSATEEMRASLGVEESLHTLVARHTYVADIGSEDRIETVLAEHVPELRELPAAGALRQQLRSAEHLGWQAERLVPALTAALDDADDPAALLTWRVGNVLENEHPPARTASPTYAQLNRWRNIIERHDSTAAPEDPEWMPVWERAAAAAVDGINADVAIHHAAHGLATRPSTDPMSAADFAADAVTAAYADQHDAGAGWQPPLPWLARPDHRSLNADEADYLQRLQAAIHSRNTELRAAVAADPPRWTAGLGPRPGDDPEAAARWDELAGLAAAFRETYGIDTTDPARPLGAPPEGHSLRARAWHQLIEHWTPELTTPSSEPQNSRAEQLRAGFGEPLFAALNDTDPLTETRTETPLSTTVHAHEDLARQLLDSAARNVLTEYAPQTLGAPAEEALLATLRGAARTGWQLDRLVPQVADLAGARDPAALLTWHLQRHLAAHEPPAPTTDPSAEQIERWQHLVTAATGRAAPDTASWQLVWRHAAAAELDGLDIETTLTRTAAELDHHRGQLDPREVAQHLVDQLAAQRDAGFGDQPALPWMTLPPAELRHDHPEIAERLHQHNDAARDRLKELRTEVATNPPQWTGGLGERPEHDTTAAQRWDELAALTAAWRETYNVRTTSPEVPLGPEPTSNTARADAWRALTQDWKSPMNPEQYANTQYRLDSLRDEVLDTREDLRDDHHVEYREEDDELDRRRAEREEQQASHSHGTGSSLNL